MNFIVTKKTGGWWFVQEIAVGGGFVEESDAVTECEQRNEGRLESKRVDAQMSNREYRQAKKTYSLDAEVKYLRNRNDNAEP